MDDRDQYVDRFQGYDGDGFGTTRATYDDVSFLAVDTMGRGCDNPGIPCLNVGEDHGGH